jgi:hypothetical protein
MPAPADRVLARSFETPEGCWVYTGARARGGYGFVRVHGKNLYAHRVTYEALRADIPPGLQIDHLCRNRACVNPWHLEPVTARVNTLRGRSIQAENARKTQCLNGHDFEGYNLRVDPTGRRICRTC